MLGGSGGSVSIDDGAGPVAVTGFARRDGRVGGRGQSRGFEALMLTTALLQRARRPTLMSVCGARDLASRLLDRPSRASARAGDPDVAADDGRLRHRRCFGASARNHPLETIRGIRSGLARRTAGAASTSRGVGFGSRRARSFAARTALALPVEPEWSGSGLAVQSVTGRASINDFSRVGQNLSSAWSFPPDPVDAAKWGGAVGLRVQSLSFRLLGAG
jgi:hypothetical protein